MTKHRKNGGSRLRQRTPKALNLEDLRRKEDAGEVYGMVTSNNGSCWTVQCQCAENPKQLQEIRCKLKKSCRTRINPKSYVKVILPDYNDKQGYITMGYRPGDVETLKASDLWDFPEDQMEQDPLDMISSNHLVDIVEDVEDPEPEETVIVTVADKVQTTSAAVAAGIVVEDDFDIDTI